MLGAGNGVGVDCGPCTCTGGGGRGGGGGGGGGPGCKHDAGLDIIVPLIQVSTSTEACIQMHSINLEVCYPTSSVRVLEKIGKSSCQEMAVMAPLMTSSVFTSSLCGNQQSSPTQAKCLVAPKLSQSVFVYKFHSQNKVGERRYSVNRITTTVQSDCMYAACTEDTVTATALMLDAALRVTGSLKTVPPGKGSSAGCG